MWSRSYKPLNKNTFSSYWLNRSHRRLFASLWGCFCQWRAYNCTIVTSFLTYEEVPCNSLKGTAWECYTSFWWHNIMPLKKTYKIFSEESLYRVTIGETCNWALEHSLGILGAYLGLCHSLCYREGPALQTLFCNYDVQWWLLCITGIQIWYDLRLGRMKLLTPVNALPLKIPKSDALPQRRLSFQFYNDICLDSLKHRSQGSRVLWQNP